MQAKKFLAGLVLVGFVLSAGILGTSKDAEAFTVPFAIYNGASNDFSATLDVTISNGTAVMKITNTSSPAGAAGESSIGTIWLEKGFSDWSSGGLINNGPGVSFNPYGSSPQPPGHLSGADNPWNGTWTSNSANSPALKNGINPGETLTLILFFKAGSTSVSNEQLTRMISDSHGNMRLGGQVLACDGDASCSITAAPIPGAIWLFASSLLGLLAVGYRRQRFSPGSAA
jgi:hypothetical protein